MSDGRRRTGGPWPLNLFTTPAPTIFGYKQNENLITVLPKTAINSFFIHFYSEHVWISPAGPIIFEFVGLKAVTDGVVLHATSAPAVTLIRAYEHDIETERE